MWNGFEWAVVCEFDHNQMWRSLAVFQGSILNSGVKCFDSIRNANYNKQMTWE